VRRRRAHQLIDFIVHSKARLLIEQPALVTELELRIFPYIIIFFAILLTNKTKKKKKKKIWHCLYEA
jgi:hypothetical protein